MVDTGTDSDEIETGSDGNLAAVENASGDHVPDVESDDGSDDGAGDGSDGESDDEPVTELEGTEQGEIGAGVDFDGDGESDVTLSGRGPLQTVVIFVLLLFVVDVAFNDAGVTTMLLEGLLQVAGM